MNGGRKLMMLKGNGVWGRMKRRSAQLELGELA